jgi:hypothetical protein
MCALSSLEVRCKRPKKKGDNKQFPQILESRSLVNKKPKFLLKKFVFECYNLMDPMELGAVIF